MSDIKKFVQEELARMKAERKKYMEDECLTEFVAWEKGATSAVLLPKIPVYDPDGSFGPRYKFQVQLGENEYTWSVNPRSPMYRELISKLEEAPAGFVLIRTGDGKQTRYDIEWE